MYITTDEAWPSVPTSVYRCAAGWTMMWVFLALSFSLLSSSGFPRERLRRGIPSSTGRRDDDASGGDDAMLYLHRILEISSGPCGPTHIDAVTNAPVLIGRRSGPPTYPMYLLTPPSATRALRYLTS
ncbi:hypothetical protein GGS23DRAFT_545379 [Durotheca rogersii]|uniref:uncharacterized protein n=1 Tax=Durotheca rogersii TaxID=419775 RepID=UPI002220B106|nr:uncharacterized protein GGS23DRAFT_545379 [Durotheca rogersii]KAI5868420.1 hypothetical protein GGS23DRAFT_545379 [Durotheca rogersii]